MTKRVGACMLAATVCPTSTLRCVTMPSIGAVMMRVIEVDLVLIERGLRLRDVAFADSTPPVRLQADCAESTAIFAASRSLCGTRLLAASSFDRVYFCWASSSVDLGVLDVGLA